MDESDRVAVANGVEATYRETERERLLVFRRPDASEGRSAVVAQNADGYAMLSVRTAPDGDELERYYGLDHALDHAGERLGVAGHDLPVPDAATDLGT